MTNVTHKKLLLEIDHIVQLNKYKTTKRFQKRRTAPHSKQSNVFKKTYFPKEQSARPCTNWFE